MKEIVDISTGEIEVGAKGIILRSVAIGSCVVAAAYDSKNNIGAMAHIMLPGRAPEKAQQKTRYAADAIDALVSQMGQLGSKKDDIEVVLVGGGNVLGRENNTICEDNIESILELLKKKHLKIKAQAVGGTNRRSVSLDIEQGIVYCAEGNGSEKQLWRAKKSLG